LGKIQEKRNLNNQNVQWIYVETKDDGRNINIVMCGGDKTRADAVRHDPKKHKWVKKNTEPLKQCDVGKEKKYSRSQDMSSSRNMLHLHQSCNGLRT
jgi:hypothetical protein